MKTDIGFIEPNVLVVSESDGFTEYELTDEMLIVLGFQFLKAALSAKLPPIKATHVGRSRPLEVID